MEIEQHPLQPFLPPNAKLLMLGSFPPPRKRWSMEFFYPNRTNMMWEVFGQVFFNDASHFVDKDNKTFHQQAIESFLKERGIALYDTAKSVIRLQNNASDKFLQVIEKTDVAELLLKIPICNDILCTGEKSATLLCETFGVQPPKIGHSIMLTIAQREVHIHRLPSTSRAYPLSVEAKSAHYQQLFKSIGLL